MYAAKNTGRGTTHYVAGMTDADPPSAASTFPRHRAALDPNHPSSRGAIDRVQSSGVIDHAIIDQAIGILRSQSGGTTDEAYAELSRTSQREDTELLLVAHCVVEDAVRRAKKAATPAL